MAGSDRLAAFMFHPFFFFPHRGGRCLVLVGRFIPRRLFTSQLFESQALASDVLRGLDKPIRIVAFAVIEYETLFVKIAEKMKRFYRNNRCL